MKITIERETFDHSYIINIDNKIAFIVSLLQGNHKIFSFVGGI